jgi:transposase
MVHRSLYRKKYPSELTDEPWAILGPMLPPTKQSNRGGRPRQVDMREVLKTIFYLNRSGCQWDMRPHDLLPNSTVSDSFAQWRTMGHGEKWSRHGVTEPVCKRGASPPQAPSVSIANRSRRPRWVAPSVGRTEARKSKGVSGICWSIRGAY